MSRKNIKRPTRQPCVGDMDKLITLSERAITSPGFGKTNFGEDFPDARKVWALVQTVNGRTRFNGVDTDVAITHEITIRYDPQVTSETWVQLEDGDRLDVVDVEDINEGKNFLVLQCTARGNQEASKL